LAAILETNNVRKIYVIGFLLMALAVLPPSYAATVRHENIAVIVNDSAITQSDIDARMKLIMTSSGLPDRPEVRAKVRPQIINTLIEEKIKIQEAKKLKLFVDQNDINNAVATLADQNKMTSVLFEKMLQSRGIKVSTLRDQIEVQLLWGRVVARQIKPNITIYDRDIDAAYQRLTAMVGQTEYAVHEILLTQTRARDEAENRDLAAKIIPEIRKNPQSFPMIAKQFSKAPGAEQGGFMGWVTPAQLDDTIGKLVKGAKVGTVIGPVKTYTGLHILWVRDVRVRTVKDVPPREDIQKRLFLERLDRMQNQYYLDLKSASFIQHK
jgi:peptidyl-prolyl cis-trans isomerase SurA